MRLCAYINKIRCETSHAAFAVRTAASLFCLCVNCIQLINRILKCLAFYLQIQKDNKNHPYTYNTGVNSIICHLWGLIRGSSPTDDERRGTEPCARNLQLHGEQTKSRATALLYQSRGPEKNIKLMSETSRRNDRYPHAPMGQDHCQNFKNH